MNLVPTKPDCQCGAPIYEIDMTTSHSIVRCTVCGDERKITISGVLRETKAALNEVERRLYYNMEVLAFPMSDAFEQSSETEQLREIQLIAEHPE